MNNTEVLFGCFFASFLLLFVRARKQDRNEKKREHLTTIKEMEFNARIQESKSLTNCTMLKSVKVPS
jgi:hypothetical protein